MNGSFPEHNNKVRELMGKLGKEIHGPAESPAIG